MLLKSPGASGGAEICTALVLAVPTQQLTAGLRTLFCPAQVGPCLVQPVLHLWQSVRAEYYQTGYNPLVSSASMELKYIGKLLKKIIK